MGPGELLVFHGADGGDADVVSDLAGHWHGHGVSHCPVDALGTDPRQAARALHRLDGWFLAVGFCGRGCVVLLLVAGNWLARHLPGVGDTGGVCVGYPFLYPGVAALAEQAGRHEAANKVLLGIEQKVRDSLGRADLPEPIALPRIESAPGTFFSAFQQLWSAQYRQRTMMIWSVWFFALLGFYGLTSWLSALLQQSGFAVTQSVYYTVIISLGGIPGFLMAAWLVERWGASPCA